LILSHVLEHVLDPRASLVRIRSVMRPGAWLYCETPDAARYSDHTFSPFQDFSTEHINHFSLVSMANLLRRCGFALHSSGVKEISISTGKPYPTLFVLSKLSLLPLEYNMERDDVTKVRLLDYVVRSGQLMRHIEDILTRALSNAPEVLVWGTGQLTWKLLADTSLAQANIAAFVDSNPASHGLTLRGRPILGPSQVESGSRPIVVASLLHQSAIVELIRQLGLANPVIALAPGAAGNYWDSAG
jgi:FlaA1/EpsC-like NDP-sugar epimerase